MAEKYYSISPYVYCADNPVNAVDPTGMLTSPIYGTDGDFLGTDENGLQGKAIVMKREDFKQGMSREEALSKSTYKDKNDANYGFRSKEAALKYANHYNNLPSRPDYDGFVTISEGIDWAKSHPNLDADGNPNNGLENATPDDALYLNSSMLNFGNLSVNNIGLSEGQQGNVNLFDFVNWCSGSSRATTYALGNTQIELLDSKQGTVKLSSDIYDWDYHNYPQARRQAGQLPENTRDRLIYYERRRAGVNDSHGFPVYMYGEGIIKTK